MSRHRWRESLHRLREKNTDPEVDEQLKQSKIDIQNKVSKALKLVNERPKNRKNRNAEGNSRRDSELSQLIEDISKQYQSLYDLHVDLRKELEQTCNEITEEGFYTASSDSSDEETSEESDRNSSLEHGSQDQEVEDLKQKFTLAAEERESLNSKHMEALSKIQELERICTILEDESKQLKEKLGDKEGDLLEITEDLETRNKDALVLIKDLEEQVVSLNHENTQLKEQTENGSNAIKQLQMKESDLEALMLDLKKAMEEKEDELSALRPVVKSLESELTGLEGNMRELEEQLLNKDQENSCFIHEVDSLLGKVSKLENMVQVYENQLPNMKEALTEGEQTLEINQLSSDKELLKGRISELEKQLGDRGDQSNMTIHIEALTREVNQLQQEVDVKRNDEIKMLLDDKEALEGKVLQLEITLTQRVDKIARLKRKLLLVENEATTRTGLVSAQMNSLQQQINLEREKSLENLSLLEKQNAELTTKTSNQQMVLKQQEVTINSLRADCKLAKSRLLQAADRKMEEMAEEFRKSFEASIRILRQRIRVAEQIQTENKEICKIIKERCDQDHLGLEKKVQEYSEMIAASKGEITNFFNATNEMLDGLQSLFDKFEDKEGDFSGRISVVLDEITVIKSLAKVTANEMKPVSSECATTVKVTSDVDDDDDDDEGSNQKLAQVETKINKDDKVRLMRGMYELQKKVGQLEKTGAEKEETILKLVEEKKEAIRQLCMSVDYHQNRCDQLIIKFHGKKRGRD